MTPPVRAPRRDVDRRLGRRCGHDTDAFGRIDVLVDNVGVNRVRAAARAHRGDVPEVVDTNLIGTFLGMKAVIEPMVEVGGGSIVTVSSPQAFEGRSGMAAYASSKFAIRGLTRTAAIELGPLGIRVNASSPARSAPR